MTTLRRLIFLPCLIGLLWLGLLPAPAIAQTQAPDNLCYMTTASGTVIDLRGLCEKPDPNRVPAEPQRAPRTGSPTPVRNPQSYAGRVSYPTPPNVYDYPAMRAFDRQVYGK